MNGKFGQRIPHLFLSALLCLGLTSCDNYFKDDYRDNSPTSGQLKVYYDEGIAPHVLNQGATFESQYERADLQLVQSTDNEAIQALYNDSCEAIVITRKLNAQEQKAFASKKYTPQYSAVAVSGLAMITHTATPVNYLDVMSVTRLITETDQVPDSNGRAMSVRVLIDRNNSAVMNYLKDSLAKGRAFAAHCNAMPSTPDAINYVANHANTIAFIDFAWLSDADDSLYKVNKGLLKFVGVINAGGLGAVPDQSNFKTGRYAFTRTIYVYRKTGDFTLAKGFESFVSGPKGQLTFLKQGLLPFRQGERSVKINQE